ncbi:MAG: ATP-binding protein, partial [Bacteroidaceae bacterium]|nr:ATP-binding protein [Bacteroidaceae bacterium]
MINKVHFKTNILLKNIIGKDLITDDNVAMLELVKNSYDAGSKIVEIVFQNVVNNDDLDEDRDDCKRSRIMVCDKGCGMDYDGLLNKWLNIAYSEKKENNQLNGRRQAGNKGVGRFSCDRLGKTLTI